MHGLNVAELIECLKDVPAHYEVRFELKFELDVPLAKENLEVSTIHQTITIARTESDIKEEREAEDDGEDE